MHPILLLKEEQRTIVQQSILEILKGVYVELTFDRSTKYLPIKKEFLLSIELNDPLDVFWLKNNDLSGIQDLELQDRVIGFITHASDFIYVDPKLFVPPVVEELLKGGYISLLSDSQLYYFNDYGKEFSENSLYPILASDKMKDNPKYEQIRKSANLFTARLFKVDKEKVLAFFTEKVVSTNIIPFVSFHELVLTKEGGVYLYSDKDHMKVDLKGQFNLPKDQHRFFFFRLLLEIQSKEDKVVQSSEISAKIGRQHDYNSMYSRINTDQLQETNYRIEKYGTGYMIIRKPLSE